jgi:hypothetical protein
LPGESDDAEPEGGVGEGEDEPAAGNVLHPAADVGGEIAGPEEAEVGIAQSADDLRQLGRFRFERLDDRRGFIGRSREVLLVEFGAIGQGEAPGASLV